jgi:hypothetical protein
VHARGASLDHRLHQLEGVERPAEARLGVGDDGRHPVVTGLALGMLDLVGAAQCLVDLAHHVGDRVDRVEALVGIHLARGVRVRGDLPAGEVDGLQSGADHLHRLVASERAERVHVVLGVQQLPEPPGSHLGQRVRDPDGPAEPFDVGLWVGPQDSLEAAGMQRLVAASGGGGRATRPFLHHHPDAHRPASLWVGFTGLRHQAHWAGQSVYRMTYRGVKLESTMGVRKCWGISSNIAARLAAAQDTDCPTL